MLRTREVVVEDCLIDAASVMIQSPEPGLGSMIDLCDLGTEHESLNRASDVEYYRRPFVCLREPPPEFNALLATQNRGSELRLQRHQYGLLIAHAHWPSPVKVLIEAVAGVRDSLDNLRS